MSVEKTIEQEIEEQHINPLLDEATDEGQASTTPETEGTEGQPAQTEGTEDQQTAGAISESGKPDSDKKSQEGKQGSSAPATEQPNELLASLKLTADKTGNLVDAQGKIVAKAGQERRFFEQARGLERVNNRQQGYIRTLETERNALKQQVGQGDPVATHSKQLGLTPEQARDGLTTVAQFNKDPLRTVKNLVDEMRANGYPIDEYLSGKVTQAQGINPSTIEQVVGKLLDSRLGPITTERANTEQQAALAQAAKQEYEGFLAKHPHADVHESVIANMWSKQPDASPTELYYKLQAYCASNGYDFTQPLAPQVEARQRASTTQPAPQQQSKPITQGRGGSANVTDSPSINAAGEEQVEWLRLSDALPLVAREVE